MPSIRHLERFVAVAEELNFRKAAVRLHMSQPPLSDSIRALEHELGLPLLARSRQGVTLTTPGITFLERARRILAQVDEAVDVTRSVALGMTGHLSVAFNPLSSYDVLPRILRRFRAQHPGVSFAFEELTTAEQEAALLEKRVDVALFLAPSVVREGLRQELFLTEQLVAVLPEHHALARYDRIVVQQLEREPFILLPPRWGTGYQARVLAACNEAGFTPKVVQQVDRIHNLVSLVAAGIGIALCPESMQRFEPHGAVFRPIDDPQSRFNVAFGVAWRDDDRSVPTTTFLEMARSAGADRAE